MSTLMSLPHMVLGPDDGLRIASEHLGDVPGAAMAKCDRFECGKASAVLFCEALVVLTQEPFDFWAVRLLKVKGHDGSSSSQMFQARGDAAWEVFRNWSKNASRIKRDIISAPCLSS